jgi:NADH:ubiquinone oxidoreductase subunit 6 (subunit J)
VSVLLASTAGEVIVWIVWVVAALALLASGFAVVLFSNPFYSALALIANLGSLAVLYLLLSAEFVAAAQVLVYAGAVMVMFLFVIAYIGHRADEPFAGGRSLARVAAIVAGGALLVEIVVVIVQDSGGRLSDSADITEAFGSPREIGTLFLTDHLLAFEVTSIILLVGAVGGVVLGSGVRRRKSDDETDLGGNGRSPLSAVERPEGPRSRSSGAAR